MADTFQLNTSWLVRLTNPHHDSTSQQIDDFAQAFTTDNSYFLTAAAALHAARQKEDEVWLTVQRDPAASELQVVNKRQDGYISAVRFITTAHAGLPSSESTKAEAQECVQIFKDFGFSTNQSYGAESDKIIQMQQNMQTHQTFLTSIGAWDFFQKAVTEAVEVRRLLGVRAMTLAEFVKGELRSARTATDQAIADLYRVIEAMLVLLPSDALTTLATQLKGLELYARQYYIGSKASSSGGSSDGGSDSGSDSGDDSGEGGSDSGDDSGGGSDDQGGGDDSGGGDDDDDGGNVN